MNVGNTYYYLESYPLIVYLQLSKQQVAALWKYEVNISIIVAFLRKAAAKLQ